MAHLFYGMSPDPLEMSDRLLAHVKVVISTKLRRNESFTLTIRHLSGDPAGRTTIWLHPAIPLRFVFDGAEPVELERDVLTRLATSANSSAGIFLDLEAESDVLADSVLTAQLVAA